MGASGISAKYMNHLRIEIWDFVYKSGPQTVDQIAERLRFDREMVNIAVAHEWFLRRGETVIIATNESTSGGKESNDL